VRSTEKVIYAGPFDTKGVYKGGISIVVNDALEYISNRKGSDLVYLPVNTCQIERNPTKQGRFSLENIINTLKVESCLKQSVIDNSAKVIYYNSSSGIPLLKDLLVLHHVQQVTKVKTIIHVHYADVFSVLPQTKILRLLTMYLLKRMEHVVFLSEETRSKMNNMGLNTSTTSTIPNFHKYDFSKEEIIDKISTSKKKHEIELLFLGALSRRKGVLDLLEALDSVEKPCVVHICGEPVDSEMPEQIDRKKKNLSTKHHLIFHGYVSGEKKRKLLLSSDAIVLPSYGEGFPIVLLEGISAGCIVVSSKVGAIHEVFSARNGYLFEAGEVQQLATILNRLTCSQSRFDTMMNNYIYSQNYTVSRFVSSMDYVVRGVIENAT